MSRPFEFSAYDLARQPITHPGKIFDRADNDGHSAVPEGGPAPYGRVLVAGRSAHQGTQTGSPAKFGFKDRYYTDVDSVSLPDKKGDFLINDATGNTYKVDNIALPLNPAGLLIVRGIGMWTEHNACANSKLKQPLGLGDIFYQPEKSGQVGMAIEGNIWCYCETDIDIGDNLFFRTAAAPAQLTNGITLLGGFSNAAGADFQAFPYGSVLRPGPAGGAFVLTLNMQK
jgi:hypothetical protein